MWIQTRQKCVCDLYFHRVVLEAARTLKGRLNSAVVSSAWRGNSTVNSCFLLLSSVWNCWCAILLNVPFFLFLKLFRLFVPFFFLFCFVSFKHWIFHSVRELQCFYLFSVFFVFPTSPGYQTLLTVLAYICRNKASRLKTEIPITASYLLSFFKCLK